MKSDIRTFVLPAGAVVSKRPTNPEEFSAMNCYEQLQELSYLYLEGVGDNFESEFLLANMLVDPDAQYDCSFKNYEVIWGIRSTFPRRVTGAGRTHLPR